VNLRTIIKRKTGPGLIERDSARLFERFYQPKGSNKEGSGLGLSIVKKIVELHQAELNLLNYPIASVDTIGFKNNQSNEKIRSAEKMNQLTGLSVEIKFWV
jgi:signal transduction histidine kinase